MTLNESKRQKENARGNEDNSQPALRRRGSSLLPATAASPWPAAAPQWDSHPLPLPAPLLLLPLVQRLMTTLLLLRLLMMLMFLFLLPLLLHPWRGRRLQTARRTASRQRLQPKPLGAARGGSRAGRSARMECPSAPPAVARSRST